MILLLALLILFRQYGTSAAPVSAPYAEPSGYNATPFIRSDCPDSSGRSVWDIVWSCLATTFAVTWVSVHPNVPWLEESSWHLLKRRIFLMCLALLAPEVMIMWAFKQWRGAVEIMETINKARPKSCGTQWTMTHAHFLQMGGFKVNYPEDEDLWKYSSYKYRRTKNGITVKEKVLTFGNLRYLLFKQVIKFPETAAKDIEDRSKSDALSKGVALLQISWFLLQLIARAHQHLAITEIELTTAALAGLNSIMYLFWWNKPFDVQCPIIIRTKELERRLVAEGRNMDEKGVGTIDVGETQIETGEQSASFLAGGTAEQTKWTFPVDEDGRLAADFGLTSHLVGRLLSTIRTTLDWLLLSLISVPYRLSAALASNKNTKKPADPRSPKSIWTCCKSAVSKLFYLPYLLMFMPVDVILDPSWFPEVYPFSDAKDKMDNTPSLQLLFNRDDMGRIMSMMFYSEYAETKPLLIFSALAGAAFGSIHCAAWDFDFPSHVEKVLWRTASLAIVGVCLCITAAIPLYNFVIEKWLDAPQRSNLETMWQIPKKTMETAPAIVYPLARVSLLILSLLSLRDLPPSALNTVTWTTFIPHV